MKLITETIENIEYIVEAAPNGPKSYYINGVFMQGDIKNRNGRMYPSNILAKESDRYNKEFVEKNRAFGELGHPAGPTINLDRASHIIKELKVEGTNVIGKAKILDTPMGKIVKALMDEGAKLGVSSRGMGSVKQNNGINMVQPDFMLATAADIVADPSAPDAFVEGIMENVEWILESGIWTRKIIEDSQKTIRTSNRRNLHEAKLRVFKQLLSMM